jgi:hypothetical protein
MKYNLLSIILAILGLVGCRSSILDDPSTSIYYSVPERSHVKLTVENSYNTVVATIVDAVQEPGHHAALFDLAGLQEGIYFYTLEAKGIRSSYYYKQTRPLLLKK